MSVVAVVVFVVYFQSVGYILFFNIRLMSMEFFFTKVVSLDAQNAFFFLDYIVSFLFLVNFQMVT